MCKAGNDPKTHTFEALETNGRLLSDCVLTDNEHEELGIKYSCFNR